MKIKVSNLGPIRGPAEIDLKPLTIFVGPNNAGKTWLAYTLAGIFSPYSFLKYIKGNELEPTSKIYLSLTKTVDDLLANGTAKVDLCQFADKYSETHFNDIASHTPEWLPEFMSTQRVSFEKLELSIELEETKQYIIDRVLASSLKSEVGLKGQLSDTKDGRKPLLSINKREGQKELYLYTFSEGDIDKQLPRELIEERLAWSILQILHRALYSDVEILPTERNTLITFQFNPSEKFKSIKDVEKENINNRPFSFPVSHYLHSAITAYHIGIEHKTKRAKDAKKIPAINEYIQLSQLLEGQILGGKIDFSHAEPEPAREIVFQPTGCPPLEISITSSMVKELAPLAFHLRYFAQPSELLIIDEPEMNLHPKAQVQILEFLAMLVNAGIHVLITTHSPYITDHILSLIKANEHTDKDAISAKFFLQDKRAFISKENVSCYLVDQGKIIDAMDENSDWNTFGKVSDTISDIYFSL